MHDREREDEISRAFISLEPHCHCRGEARLDAVD